MSCTTNFQLSFKKRNGKKETIKTATLLQIVTELRKHNIHDEDYVELIVTHVTENNLLYSYRKPYVDDKSFLFIDEHLKRLLFHNI